MTGFADIDETIAGLHALAAWRTDHPDIDVRQSSLGPFAGSWNAYPHYQTLPVAAIVSAFADGAPLGAVTKEVGTTDLTEDTLFIGRDFGGGVVLCYQAVRDEVCTRRVVGTETVMVPDPDAPLVEQEREIVEWDCHPILGRAS